MRRSPKPVKSKVNARLPVTRRSPKNEGAPAQDLEKRLAESLKREAEAFDQQTATSEILGVISRSPTDVQPVFDAIVASARRLCDAVYSGVYRVQGDMLQFVAHNHESPESLRELERSWPIPVQSPTSLICRVIRDRAVVHVVDIESDPTVPEVARARSRVIDQRTLLAVPMLRDGIPIGAIRVSRREPKPFSDTQIALLQTFADQAVIAVENTRLFNETKEALDQQTATSDILKVIASSPTDVQPVFDAVAESAARLCDSRDAHIFRRDGDLLHLVAHHGSIPIQSTLPLVRGTANGRAVLDGRTVHVIDMQSEVDEFPEGSENARLMGHRTTLNVPLMREGMAIGAIGVRRTAARLFTERQVTLLQTFADQAVIAIENVRLFKELEEKNRALTEAHAQVSESLEQQTATGEILGVISRSPTDTQPVFDAIAANAARLCSANDAQVLRVDGEVLRLVAAFGAPSMPSVRRLTRGHLVGRAVIDRKTIHVRDLAQALAEYPETTAAPYGVQSALAVPLLREGVALGVIRISRTEIRPFTDNQIELLKTFADQAVIAIENVRLFNELQTRTGELSRSVEQLTALGEISRAVSSTLNVEAVLDTIVSRASQLASAAGCSIYEYDEAAERFELRATHNYDAEFVEAIRAAPLSKGEGLMGRAAEMREPVQIPDITKPGAYQSSVRDTLIRFGYRALLSVPLLREDQIIGSLSFTRKAPGEFPPEIVDVLKTFATQSALAIQNARLFREIEAKSRELEVASQHKSEFLANMSHELRTPLNAIIGFSEVLTDRMFGDLNEKQEEYLKDIYSSGTHLLSLINDILDLSKIEAGRMELELTDFHLPTALDNALALVRERAGRRSLTLQTGIDEQLGEIRADERKIRQVVLNLLSNAIKFTPEGGRIEVGAVPRDGFVEVSISDTGVGIAPQDQEAVFEEFRQVGTADKKAEGTGLGLTLCRKFVELHGGKISVKSLVGVGSTFTFTIPVRYGG
jgi:signal transduction histidine kinase